MYVPTVRVRLVQTVKLQPSGNAVVDVRLVGEVQAYQKSAFEPCVRCSTTDVAINSYKQGQESRYQAP